MKNNLIGILDQTFPGVNTYFDSPTREDGSQKWVDFASTYWHVDCVRKMSLNAFVEHYRKWCCRRKYNFSRSKAEDTANEELVIRLRDGREVQEMKPIYRLLHHYNSLSNKMGNSLLAVRDINHKYIVVERKKS